MLVKDLTNQEELDRHNLFELQDIVIDTIKQQREVANLTFHVAEWEEDDDTASEMIQDILNITEDITESEKELVNLSYTIEENLAVDAYFHEGLPTEQYFEAMDLLKEAIRDMQMSGFVARKKLKNRRTIDIRVHRYIQKLIKLYWDMD